MKGEEPQEKMTEMSLEGNKGVRGAVGGVWRESQNVGCGATEKGRKGGVLHSLIHPASLRRRKWGPIMGMRGPGHGL